MRLCTVFFLLLFSISCHAGKIKLSQIDDIELYAINPTIDEPFVYININNIVETFDSIKNGNYYYDKKNLFFYARIKKQRTLNKFIQLFDDLDTCKALEKDQMLYLDVRFVLKINYGDGTFDYVAIAPRAVQFIYAFDYELKPSKKLLKFVLKQMPFIFRLLVRPYNGTCYDSDTDYSKESRYYYYYYTRFFER